MEKKDERSVDMAKICSIRTVTIEWIIVGAYYLVGFLLFDTVLYDFWGAALWSEQIFWILAMAVAALTLVAVIYHLIKENGAKNKIRNAVIIIGIAVAVCAVTILADNLIRMIVF